MRPVCDRPSFPIYVSLCREADQVRAPQGARKGAENAPILSRAQLLKPPAVRSEIKAALPLMTANRYQMVRNLKSKCLQQDGDGSKVELRNPDQVQNLPSKGRHRTQ